MPYGLIRYQESKQSHFLTFSLHVHLLLSEPARELVATAIQALKISVARRAVPYGAQHHGAFWQKRYYDHNVRTHASFIDKLRYMHRNPVKRGLVDKPEDWKWSSLQHYAAAEMGPVEIEAQWTVDRRTERTPKLLKLRED